MLQLQNNSDWKEETKYQPCIPHACPTSACPGALWQAKVDWEKKKSQEDGRMLVKGPEGDWSDHQKDKIHPKSKVS
jgi:hypothetical protein